MLGDRLLIDNSFKLLYLNIRSLKRNLDKLNTLLIRYNLNPDVITLTETWLNNKTFFNPMLSGYVFVKGQLSLRVGAGFLLKEI